ncbi:MAG: glycosyltransferase [Eubacteriales bacterium]|nr:glycosyltransferase [Eubacteriales bacterium]
MAQISFSIVVVCLNAGPKLLDTVNSVLAQKYGNYEIIVKDGGSADGSLSCLPADSRIHVYTAPDRGIYDAMNQAVKHISGQFVQFLNCGDRLHDAEVLERMARAIARKKSRAGGKRDGGESVPERERIFYGNQYLETTGCVVYSAPEVNDFTCYRNVPCHQVCFYDARLFDRRGYDLRYRVRADYEHFLYCIYERKAEAVYTELLVADYEGGGFSETKENRRISEREHREITRLYLGRKKALRYRSYMLLSLAPLRARLAESSRFSESYNRIKSGVYRRLRRGGREGGESREGREGEG